jgi:dolichol-phosphate mannosyltransferase
MVFQQHKFNESTLSFTMDIQHIERKFSLIIPTYDEAGSVEELVERIWRCTKDRLLEIIIVDDDSLDGTADLARSLSDRYPVRVLVRKEKRGLATAVIDGIGETKAEIVGVIDADLQHPPEAIPALLHALDHGADIAIGSRYVSGGRCGDWALIRRVASFLATVLVHISAPSTRRIKDPMSGFYLFHGQVIHNIPLHGTGFKILLEILLKGVYRQVTEVPYTFDVRRFGRSKLGLRQLLEYLVQIIRYMTNKGEFFTF